MASNRLDYLRGLLLQELGPFGRYTATGNGAVDGTTVICATAFRSSSLSSSSTAYEWLMVPSLNVPRQRRITKTGLDVASGTLTVDAPLSAQVPATTPFEVSGTIPLEREYNTDDLGSAPMMGARECLNASLRLIEIPNSDLTLTIANDQRDYALSTWRWLDRPRRLVDVLQRNATDTAWVSAKSQGHDWEFVEDDDGSVLRFHAPYRIDTGTYTLRLRVLQPADTWINGAASTVGLMLDADTCGSDPDSIIPIAKAYAYAALRDTRSEPARSHYHALYTAQVQIARGVKGYNPDADIDRGVPQAPEAA